MTGCDVIICETSGRWAASLRSAIRRSGGLQATQPNVRETRSLSEFALRLAEISSSLGLIEVRSSNLNEVLVLLAGSRVRWPHAHFVALLEIEHEMEIAEVSLPREALWAGGAIDIVTSPRGLKPVLEIAARIARMHRPAPISDETSLTEWARGLLPWQDAGRPIG